MGRHRKSHGHCKALNKRTGRKHKFFHGKCVTPKEKARMKRALKRKHKH